MFAYGCRYAGKSAGPAAAAAACGVAGISCSAEKASSRFAAGASQRAAVGGLHQLLTRHRHQLLQQQQQQQRAVWTTSTATRSSFATAAKMTGATSTRGGSCLLPRNNGPSSVPFSSKSGNGGGNVGGGGGGGSSASGSSAFVQWYEGYLEARPVPTKMATGMLLWSIGDAVAQVVPVVSGQVDKPLTYDFARTGRAAAFGFLLHAPTSHVHFNFLEWLTHRFGVTGLQIPFFKAFMEQFVYWSWVSNSMYHAAMGAMQGLDAKQIYNRIADVLWDTQKAQWVFWIPVQLLNFQFVPVRHQLNVVLLTSIVWTALLSAWYPPLEEGAESGGGAADADLKRRNSLDQKTALRAVKPE